MAINFLIIIKCWLLNPQQAGSYYFSGSSSSAIKEERRLKSSNFVLFGKSSGHFSL